MKEVKIGRNGVGIGLKKDRNDIGIGFQRVGIGLRLILSTFHNIYRFLCDRFLYDLFLVGMGWEYSFRMRGN